MKFVLSTGLMGLLLFGLGVSAFDTDGVSVRFAADQQPLRFIDLKQMRDALEWRLQSGASPSEVHEWLNRQPWVAAASLSRLDARDMRVHIIERKPVAYLSQRQMLDDTGVQFQPEPLPALPLVKLRGHQSMDDPQRMLEIYRRVQQALGTSWRIGELYRDPVLGLVAVLRSGGRVLLGRNQNRFDQQMRTLAQFVRVVPNKPARPRIDLRHRLGLALAEEN